ncbi:MAG: aspartate kinase [Bdellovibrionales bacterium]
MSKYEGFHTLIRPLTSVIYLSMSKVANVVVKKYGGTSVATVERIQNVAKRVLEDKKRGQKPVVVVSAMAGETNRLVQLAKDTFSDYRGASYDMLLASGEQVAVSLLSMAFESLGQKARPYLAHQLNIRTDSMHSRARILTIDADKLLHDIDDNIIPVIAGFQGVDEKGHITTLGRGGSDTTAVAVAAALKLRECEIYTDVPAVYSADPRIVPKAREIEKLSFEEMLEMASLGSKVLHSRSVEIGAKHNVLIHVRSTFELREGTWVVPEGEIMENAVVSSVTHETNTSVLTIHPVERGTQVLSDLFEELSINGVVIDIISQSDVVDGQRLSFSVSDDDREMARKIAQNRFPKSKIAVMDQVAKVTIIGVGMRNHPGVAAKFFKTLSALGVQVHLVTTSEIKVSAVIDREKLMSAAQALHTAFGLDAKT